jgi:DNA adenine methylase
MQYFGGKKRIAPHVLCFLNNYLYDVKYYFEPFVGSACIVEGISKEKRFASDKNEYLIEMYNAIKNNWEPPTVVTEEDYNHIKEHKDENKALTGFVGIGCSYSGKWFGGYARNSRGDNYAKATYNSLMKQKPLIENVIFKSIDYRECHPKNALIYCDPPYAETTKYDAVGKFNSLEFWETARKWSKNNVVFISEYNAPDDFKCVLEIKTKTEIRNKDNIREPRVEKLFKYVN